MASSRVTVVNPAMGSGRAMGSSQAMGSSRAMGSKDMEGSLRVAHTEATSLLAILHKVGGTRYRVLICNDVSTNSFQSLLMLWHMLSMRGLQLLPRVYGAECFMPTCLVGGRY